jgi:hypothetical protein
MREWLRDGGDIRAGGDEMAVDLSVTRYKYNHNNQLVLESKDDIKKRGMLSPDYADALALTFGETIPLEESRRIPGPEPYIGMTIEGTANELDSLFNEPFVMS